MTAELGAHWFPNRGVGTVPPTDPVIYRLYEAMLVYGYPIKVRSVGSVRICANCVDRL